jgi:hypothetical protein
MKKINPIQYFSGSGRYYSRCVYAFDRCGARLPRLAGVLRKLNRTLE